MRALPRIDARPTRRALAMIPLGLAAALAPDPRPTPAATSRGAGAVLALVCDDASGTVFAGTAAGGLYRSADAGANWAIVEGALAGLSVSALVADSGDPGTVYAGTNGAGIFRGAGKEWAAANTGLTNLFVEALAADAGPPRAIYAATDGGVFQSRDGARTWTDVSAGLPETFATAVAVLPDGTVLAGTRRSGIYKRDPGGERWSVSAGFGRATVRGFAASGEPATIYVASEGGLFKAPGSGDGWTPVNAGLTSTSILALAADPAGAGRLYASTVSGLFRTTNGGGTWSAVETGAAGSFFNTVVVPRQPAGVVLAGADGAVVRSADSGKTWTVAKLPPPPAVEEDEEEQ